MTANWRPRMIVNRLNGSHLRNSVLTQFLDKPQKIGHSKQLVHVIYWCKEVMTSSLIKPSQISYLYIERRTQFCPLSLLIMKYHNPKMRRTGRQFHLANICTFQPRCITNLVWKTKWDLFTTICRVLLSIQHQLSMAIDGPTVTFQNTMRCAAPPEWKWFYFLIIFFA